MSDTGNLTVNILGSGGDSAIINTNMVESSSVTANVVTGAKGDKGDKGDVGPKGYTGDDSTVPGPPNVLAVGTVTTGAAGTNAAATITGASPVQTLNLTIPRGNTGSPTEFELRGTGSPEGVVTAPVGTYYTDTVGTTGAWRWLKKTGTGNTGWKVVHGDTGWRNITTFINGWTGRLQLRRINDELHYRTDYSGANALVGTAATARVFLAPNTLGAGMFFIGEHRTLNYRATGAVFGNSYYYQTGWELPAFGNAVDVYTFPAGSFFVIDAAWPTSLPGTAA